MKQRLKSYSPSIHHAAHHRFIAAFDHNILYYRRISFPSWLPFLLASNTHRPLDTIEYPPVVDLDQDSRGRRRRSWWHVDEVQSWERKATQLVSSGARWPMCANHKRAIISEPRRFRSNSASGHCWKSERWCAPLCDEIPFQVGSFFLPFSPRKLLIFIIHLGCNIELLLFFFYD